MSPREPQLDLFGDAASGLQAAPERAEDLAVAQRLPAGVYLGTMSWSFPGWAGLVYAPGTPERLLSAHGLSAYCQHPLLRAVEIDRTFYAPVGADVFRAYASQVPEAFRFIVKAHQACTTFRGQAGALNPEFLDPAYAIEQVVEPCLEGLGTKLGVLVFQFSPQDLGDERAFASRLRQFLAALPSGPAYAVELRNASLLTPWYADALAATGALHCHNAWSHMPSPLSQRDALPDASRRILVARWLLKTGDVYDEAKERYQPFGRIVDEDLGTRADLTRLIADALAAGRPAFVTINNKAEGCAPESVFRLARAVAGQA